MEEHSNHSASNVGWFDWPALLLLSEARARATRFSASFRTHPPAYSGTQRSLVPAGSADLPEARRARRRLGQRARSPPRSVRSVARHVHVHERDGSVSRPTRAALPCVTLLRTASARDDADASSLELAHERERLVEASPFRVEASALVPSFRDDFGRRVAD